jgi:hypothetical protein
MNKRPEPKNTKPTWWDSAMKRVVSMDEAFGEYDPDPGAAYTAIETALSGNLSDKQSRECIEEAAILIYHSYINGIQNA